MKHTKLLLICALAIAFSCDGRHLPSSGHRPAQEMDSARAINAFDRGVMAFFQQYSHKSPVADNFFRFFTYNNVFQGGVLMLAFWWLWFLPAQQGMRQRREKMILSLSASLIAIFVGRAIVHITPQRMRPLENPSLSLQLPFGTSDSYADRLSCFPSDHAVLFFSIAAGLFIISKRVGLFAFLYTSVFITATRVYFCYHYATDVIAGAAIGISVTYLVVKSKLAQDVAGRIYGFSIRRPQVFYPLFFLVSYQIADLFEGSRNAAAFFLRVFFGQWT